MNAMPTVFAFHLPPPLRIPHIQIPMTCSSVYRLFFIQVFLFRL